MKFSEIISQNGISMIFLKKIKTFFDKRKKDPDFYVDWMSILIEKEDEKKDWVDYIFKCNVSGPDPRYKSRSIVMFEARGLFRIDKKTLESSYLMPMMGDVGGARYMRAAAKIISEFKEKKHFPDFAHRACG